MCKCNEKQLDVPFFGVPTAGEQQLENSFISALTFATALEITYIRSIPKTALSFAIIPFMNRCPGRLAVCSPPDNGKKQ